MNITILIFLGHVFLERPEMRHYSKMWSDFGGDALKLVHDTIEYNNICLTKESKPLKKYLVLRINANMTFPTPDTRRTPPHEDHSLKHLNMIFYLTSSGARTFCGEDEHDPKEDDIILFKGEHNFELPKISTSHNYCCNHITFRIVYKYKYGRRIRSCY